MKKIVLRPRRIGHTYTFFKTLLRSLFVNELVSFEEDDFVRAKTDFDEVIPSLKLKRCLPLSNEIIRWANMHFQEFTLDKHGDMLLSKAIEQDLVDISEFETHLCNTPSLFGKVFNHMTSEDLDGNISRIVDENFDDLI